MKQLSVKEGNRDADERRNNVMQMRRDAEEGHIEVFKRMTKCDQMTIGMGWEPQARKRNRERGKFALSVNNLLSFVKQITGKQIQNPQDITAFPLKGTTVTRARLLSGLIKHMLDEQQWERKSSIMHEMGTTLGRGFHIIDKSWATGDPVNGNLSIHSPSSYMVMPDPACRVYDYNDVYGGARYFWWDSWIPKDLVRGWFPAFKDQLDSVNYDANAQGFMSVADHITNFFSGFGGALGVFDDDTFTIDDDYCDTSLTTVDQDTLRGRNNYRVSVCYEKRWKEGGYVVFPETGQVQTFFDQATLRREQERTQQTGEAVQVVTKDGWDRPIMVPVLYRHTTIGDLYIEAIEDPFEGVMDLPCVRYAPYFNHGYEYGDVQNMIGPQIAANWGFSQALNMVKKITNSRWLVRAGLKKHKEWLTSDGDMDGVVIDRQLFGGDVEKLDGSEYAPALASCDNLTERSIEFLHRISAIQKEDPRFNNKNIPLGVVAIQEEKAQQGMATSSMRFNWTGELLGRQITNLVVQTMIYGDEEIQLVIDQEDLISPDMLEQARNVLMIAAQIDGQKRPEQPDEFDQIRLPVSIPGAETLGQQGSIQAYKSEAAAFDELMDAIDKQAKDMAIEMMLDDFRKLGMGKYGIKIALSNSSITHRLAKRVDMLELSRSLVEEGQEPIPREVKIKESDIANKEAILTGAA